jgi:hypothetical protein
MIRINTSEGMTSRFPLPASNEIPYHELHKLDWIVTNIWEIYRKGWIGEQRWLAETKEANHIYKRIFNARRDYYDKYLHPDILIDYKLTYSASLSSSVILLYDGSCPGSLCPIKYSLVG